MTSSSLLQTLAATRAALGVRPDQIAATASLPILEVGRMERADEDVRLDLVLGYAAALGCAITLRREMADFAGAALTTVDPTDLAAELELLRAEFGACREGLDLSPTALARYANLTAKTVFALERGPQIPKLSTALAHAQRFGLTLRLCARGGRTPPATVRSLVADDLAAIYERIGSATKSTSSHHLKAPCSEMEAEVARVLVEAYERLGLPHRAFARSADLNWKTIFPEGVPSFTGRFGTTASVAARLGHRILAVPAGLPVGRIVDAHGSSPVEDPDLSDVQALDLARAFARRRKELGHTFAEINRRGGATVQTVRNFETNPVGATLAQLCRHAGAIGLAIVAVPEAAVEEIRAAIGMTADVPPRPRPPANGAGRHFNPEVDARKREIMVELCRAVSSCAGRAVRDADAATLLGVPQRDVEGLADGRRYRAKAVEFAALLRATGTILRFEDKDGGFTARLGAAEAAEGEIESFFGRAAVHRQGSGLVPEAAGARIGISGSRFQHMERGDPKILTTSLMLYAEALGLAWRVERAAARSA
jgi:DNA-binding XRE family transcriptional regulator